MTNKKIFNNLIKNINWENWENEEKTNDEQTKYFDICEVLYSKLEWLKEEFNKNLDDNDETEHLDTINEVQILLSLLNEEKIKQIL